MSYRTEDLINPIKWWAVFKYLTQKYIGTFFGYVSPEDKQWQAEVIVFRGIMCPDCKIAGECVGIMEDGKACGCNWAGKSGDMSMECSLGNWKPVKDEEDWKEQKGKYMHGLKIGLVKDERSSI